MVYLFTFWHGSLVLHKSEDIGLDGQVLLYHQNIKSEQWYPVSGTIPHRSFSRLQYNPDYNEKFHRTVLNF